MTRRLIIVPFILLSLVLLTACGSGSSTPAATSASSASSQSASPTSAPAAAPTTIPKPTQVPAPTDVPAPTNTPATLAGGAGCLVGTWQFEDISAYLSSIMSKANDLGQEGTFIYTFGADGKARLEAQNFKAKLELTNGKVSIPMDINLTGSATAEYVTSDPDKVTISNTSNGDFRFSVSINGQESSVITGNQLAGLGMSSDPMYNTFTYECSADTLRYTPPISNAQTFVLKRVSP
jgi:hypothetical protein